METDRVKLKSKPPWLKKRISLNNKNIVKVKRLIEDLNLNTVCQSAKCPNIFECFSKRTATFMLMGNSCTRNCAFCSVFSRKPLPLDKGEPHKVAIAAKEMGLRYVVLTSVTRDDLKDGGAGHFLNTVSEIKKILPESSIECLIPDFNGNKDSLAMLLNGKIDVLNHNIETIRRNYKKIRNGADYGLSLDLLKSVKSIRPDIITKSGFMLGLGEDWQEVIGLLWDLKQADVDIITIGQYLRPTDNNTPVRKYYTPDEFRIIKGFATDMGFKYVLSGVFVRSSYMASTAFKDVKRAKK